jgi:hypothetical protein
MRVGRSVEAAQADQQRARNSTGLGQIPNAAPRQGLGPLGERRTRVLILRADCQRTVTRGSCARSADITAFTQRFRRIQLLGARVPAPLCSRHVWPCPSLLRCQRDQTRLLDPAGSADTQHQAQLECSADRPSPGGSLRREGWRAHPRRDALRARAVLGEGHQSRLREHQRQSRGDREQASPSAKHFSGPAASCRSITSMSGRKPGRGSNPSEDFESVAGRDLWGNRVGSDQPSAERQR